jgi:hypothetical protein
MLGHPGGIIAERVGSLYLCRHAGVDVTMWIGLAGVMGV